MKKIFYSTSIILLIIHTIGYNQKPYPCGTSPQKTEWLKEYQKNPAQFKTVTDSLLLIPMTIHSVGSDNGGGLLATDRILDAFCTLNEDYEQAGIQFYLSNEINLINNSAINNHDDLFFGGRFMNEVGDPNTLNTFIVSSPNGNCGYNIVWSHMMLSKSCSDRSDHTWAHEVGHHFSIQHPFLGWEGGQTHDGTIPANFSQPAPEFVTYNYTPFFYENGEDTTIIDTAFIELVDGSNCQFAADGFCDTKPDYIAPRWNCNNDSESGIEQTDPTGAKFRSDGTLIMSSANDECSSKFSDEQIAAMRAFVIDQKPFLLDNQVSPMDPVVDEVQMIFPGENETVPFNSVDFQWEAVPNATEYLIQVSRLPNFAVNVINVSVDDNFLTTPDLGEGITYHWRVRPFSNFSTCAPWSESQSFSTSEISAVAKIDGLNDFKIFPTLLTAGNNFSIQIDSNEPIEGIVQMTDLTGKVILNQPLNHSIGSQVYEIPTADFRRGLYLVGLVTSEGTVIRKLILD